jgi:hypothetical protein
MKFKLKREHENSQIITKDKSGNDVLVTKHEFNDHFAELMFANNLGHLIEINPLYEEILSEEKKTFTQVTENVIALTSNPLLSESEQPKPTPVKRGKRSDAGKPRTQKA